jgi:two-component system response regulator PhoP
MRLLIVEDEDLLAAQVDRFLRDRDFVVDIARDGEVGLYQAREYDYAAAVIDLGLPKLDGMALIETLRRDGSRLPVLILTARGNWQDKVRGLEAGADDYLTKPFHMEELLARINVLIRRAAGYASAVIERGPLRLDTASKDVRMAGAEVELTDYEYRMLEYFAMNPSRVVSRAELTDHLYDQDFERESNVIEVLLGRLRRKLDPDGKAKPIRTVRGQGYRLTLGPDG